MVCSIAQTDLLRWRDRQVRQEDLPWLRRGRSLLTAFTGAIHQGGGSGVFPAWSRDARVTVTGTDSTSSTPSTYRSAVWSVPHELRLCPRFGSVGSWR